MRKLTVISTILAGSLAIAGCSVEPDSTDPAAPAEAELAFADLTGDAAAGERAYGKCRSCHLLEPGRNTIGPTLHGVVGRQAGTVAGFNYSDANASADLEWTPEALFDYLENPREFMPGNRMPFAGISDPQERADIVAFLETQGG